MDRDIPMKHMNSHAQPQEAWAYDDDGLAILRRSEIEEDFDECMNPQRWPSWQGGPNSESTSSHNNNPSLLNPFGSWNVTQHADLSFTEHGLAGTRWPPTPSMHPNPHEQAYANSPPATLYSAYTSNEAVQQVDGTLYHHNLCGLNASTAHVTTDNTPVPGASVSTTADRVWEVPAWGSSHSLGVPSSSSLQKSSTRPVVGRQDHVATTQMTTTPPSAGPSSVVSPPPTDPRVPSSRYHTYKCLVDNCGLIVRVDIASINEHLSRVHGYLSSRDQEQECRWMMCVCRCRKRQPPDHRSHTKDMPKHIWDTHMGFRDPCSKCGEVRWVAGFSKRRHEETCTGGHPRRCTLCYEEFLSELELGMHYKLETCPGRSAARARSPS